MTETKMNMTLSDWPKFSCKQCWPKSAFNRVYLRSSAACVGKEMAERNTKIFCKHNQADTRGRSGKALETALLVIFLRSGK